jgi:hypothetical protein
MTDFSDGKLSLAASACEVAAAAAFAVAAMARAASAAGCPAVLVAAAAEQAAQVLALAFAGLGPTTKGASGASECSTGSSCGAPCFAPFGPAARAPPPPHLLTQCGCTTSPLLGSIMAWFLVLLLVAAAFHCRVWPFGGPR